VTEKDRAAVREYFPFTDEAPAWVVAQLKDYNNLTDIK